jgi:DNA-binding beta-propeller fold protein YncE
MLPRTRLAGALAAAVACLAALSACGGGTSASTAAGSRADAGADPPEHAQAAGSRGRHRIDVYRYDTPSDLSRAVAGDPALVYVPNSESNTVTVISQRTLRIVGQFPVGALPQHVTPAHDLRTLYVDNDDGNSLTPIDPRTGRPGKPIPVEDPYNLYFTPDGRFAIVVEERMQTLAFRDPRTMRLEHLLNDPSCAGIDHMDFSAAGNYAFASCEFAGRMVKIDLRRLRVVSTLLLAGGNSSPQDVKLSPDGRVLYAADQAGGGVWEIDPKRFRVIGFLHTGAGAHGLYPSRDAGTVSVVSFLTRRVVATWVIPGPASPDMGGVSADGRTLWLSGRYNAEVYAIDTATGRLRARIPVGLGPHGLCVWPQPGRFSLGHTGIMR